MALIQIDPESKQLSVAKIDDETMLQLEMKGRVVQPRLSKFAEMLAHPEFAEFFDQNFQTWDDCQTSIMMLKMGSKLKTMLQNSSGQEVSGHQLAAAMSHIMNHSDTRQYMVSKLKEFIKGN